MLQLIIFKTLYNITFITSSKAHLMIEHTQKIGCWLKWTAKIEIMRKINPTDNLTSTLSSSLTTMVQFPAAQSPSKHC